MTRDEIIQIAIESGIPKENIPMLAFGRSETGTELLESFANLIEANHCNKHCASLLKIRETLLRVYKLCPREREADIMAAVAEIDAMNNSDEAAHGIIGGQR